mmetsp:Transcript_13833/g.41065  ORF Transcript_13833/g.41065 Transcript_13833/m.41065 type:complete len:230 (+) Transcript_13833:1912-2601(+)
MSFGAEESGEDGGGETLEAARARAFREWCARSSELFDVYPVGNEMTVHWTLMWPEAGAIFSARCPRFWGRSIDEAIQGDRCLERNCSRRRDEVPLGHPLLPYTMMSLRDNHASHSNSRRRKEVDEDEEDEEWVPEEDRDNADGNSKANAKSKAKSSNNKDSDSEDEDLGPAQFYYCPLHAKIPHTSKGLLTFGGDYDTRLGNLLSASCCGADPVSASSGEEADLIKSEK